MAARGQEPLRWGLLSTARINEKVLLAARESSKVAVLGVASRRRETAEAFAAAHGLERAYGSYEALLEDDDVDAVYVSLPNHLHVEWSIRALEAGKHVLSEKPLARHPGAAERAFDVAERTDRVLSEAFMWRHHPQAHELTRLVADGAIGELRRIRSSFGFELGGTRTGIAGIASRMLGRGRAPLDIRLVPEFDGGALMDVGCYCVSAARLLGGEPQRVEAEQVLGPTGVDVRFSGRLELAGGVEASFECWLAGDSVDELEVIGSDGSLFLDDPYLCRNPAIEVRRADGRVEAIAIPHVDPYRLELENIADAAAGVAPLLLGRSDAVAQARTLDALFRAATS